MKRLFEKFMIIIHIIIVSFPVILAIHHFNGWVDHGGFTPVPLANFIYTLTGFDLTFNGSIISKDMVGFYRLYAFIIEVPLFFWVAILLIPSFIKLYRLSNE